MERNKVTSFFSKFIAAIILFFQTLFLLSPMPNNGRMNTTYSSNARTTGANPNPRQSSDPRIEHYGRQGWGGGSYARFRGCGPRS